MPTRFVEKPPHVDETRNRLVDAGELLDSIDLERPELAAVADALDRDDQNDALDAVLHHFKAGTRPKPLSSRRDLLETFTDEQRGMTLATAQRLAERSTDFTDGTIGRSRFYALHYLAWTTDLLDAYALTGDRDWVDRWAVTFDRWHEQREHAVGAFPGLDPVWYTLGVATRTQVCLDALDLCWGALPRGCQVRVLATLLGGCRWLADEHDAFRPGNWQFVGACSLLRAAALLPEFRESSAWARTAHERVVEHLDMDVYSDGGHLERAPSYHMLCLTHLRDAAAHAQAFLGMDLTGHPSYSRMHDWPVAMSTPDGWLPPFQDSAPIRLAATAASWTEPVPSSWRAPDDDRPQDHAWDQRVHHWLAGSKYVVSRGGWHRDDLYSAVNCGPAVPHELESHSHRASLDFVLWGYGAPLAWEAGGPVDYDDPGYRSWYQSAAAHNTVLVADRDLGTERDATVDAVFHTPSADVFTGHHDGWGARHARTLLFVRPNDSAPGYWFVVDMVEGNDPWRWRLHGTGAWRQVAHRTWRTTSEAGLVAHVVDGDLRSWQPDSGATRYPRGDGLTAGTLHCLELHPAGRSLSTVLLPFNGQDAWSVHRDHGVVACAGVTDVLGDRCWLRRSGTDATRALAWLGGQITDDAGPLLAAPAARLVHARWRGGLVEMDVRCSGRCEVAVRAANPTAAHVGRTRVPVSVRDGLVVVTVPEAGDWRVTVHGEPDVGVP